MGEQSVRVRLGDTGALPIACRWWDRCSGSSATVRARHHTSALRARWLVLAAFAIGGTGIWTMHFLAMIGFAVDGTAVRYDMPITVASWLTAVIVVGIGLFIVGIGRPRCARSSRPACSPVPGRRHALLRHGRHAGQRPIGYDRRYVIASIIIAVAAATVALWFTVTVRRPVAVVVSALVMGVAISGMHYTGMFGRGYTCTRACNSYRVPKRSRS